MKDDLIITEAEYQELVERVSTGANRISKSLVGDFKWWQSRSLLGRYLQRVAREYYNSRRVLMTVINKSVESWVEEDAWCFYDYAVASYYVDGNQEVALRRVLLVRQWILEHEDELEFLTKMEIELTIKMLQGGKSIQNEVVE